MEKMEFALPVLGRAALGCYRAGNLERREMGGAEVDRSESRVQRESLVDQEKIEADRSGPGA